MEEGFSLETLTVPGLLWPERKSRFNSLPQPARIISLDRYLYWQVSNSYSPTGRTYQHIIEGMGTLHTLRTIWYQEFGLGMASRFYWNPPVTKEFPEDAWIPGGYQNSGFILRFYRFGCAHKMRELSVKECKKRGIMHFGMCWHVYECQLCGFIRATDSSD